MDDAVLDKLPTGDGEVTSDEVVRFGGGDGRKEVESCLEG